MPAFAVPSDLGCRGLYRLDFQAAELDLVPSSDLISSMASVFQNFQPEEVFLPHPQNIHSNHRISFNAAVDCTKWFRYLSVRRFFSCEILLETNFSFDQFAGGFV